MSLSATTSARCSTCAIRSSALCSVLSRAELALVDEISHQRTFEEGQTVVSEDEPGVIGNVAEGVLVETMLMADGREQVVSILMPADFIGGELSGPADTTIQAVSRVTLCIHDRAAFGRLMETQPALRRAYLEHAKHQMKNARDWMLLLGQKTSEERLATFLLRLATRQAEAGCSHFMPDAAGNGQHFDIPISRAQIAAHLGITIETVSRKMRILQDSDAIELVGPRTVMIKNAARLRAMAE